MYGGPSTSFLRYEPLKNDVTIFDPFSGLKTRFRHFPTPGNYLLYPDLAIPLMISIQYRQRTSIRYTR